MEIKCVDSCELCGAREETCREESKYWVRNTYVCSIIGWNVRVKLEYYKIKALYIIIELL